MRPYYGVVILGGEAAQDLGCQAMAAALATGLGAVVSHGTTARLIGVDGMGGLPGVWSPSDDIHVTVGADQHPREHAGIVIHRSAVPRDQRATFDGIPVTSVLRTLADVALWLPREPALVALEMALHRRLLRLDALPRIADLCHRRPGAKRAVSTLAMVRVGAESVLETLSRLRLADRGLPAAEIQPVILDHKGRFLARADLGFRRGTRRVLGEADSVQHHNGRQMRLDDARRECKLRLQGEQIVRWDWADMVAGMGAVATTINRFLDL